MPKTIDTDAQIAPALHVVSYETPKDGNCFFHSILAELKQLPEYVRKSDREIIYDIRCRIVDYMILNRALYLPFLGGEPGFDRHVAKFLLEQPGSMWEWVDHPEIYALSQILHRPIIIIAGDLASGQNHTFIGTDDFANAKPLIVFYKNKNHYQEVAPRPGAASPVHNTNAVVEILSQENKQAQKWQLEMKLPQKQEQAAASAQPVAKGLPVTARADFSGTQLKPRQDVELTSNLMPGPTLILISEADLLSNLRATGGATYRSFAGFGNRAILITEDGLYYFYYAAEKGGVSDTNRNIPEVEKLFHVDCPSGPRLDSSVRLAREYLGSVQLADAVRHLSPQNIVLEAIRHVLGLPFLCNLDIPQRNASYSDKPLIRKRLTPRQYETIKLLTLNELSEQLYTDTDSLIRYLLTAREFNEFLMDFSEFFKNNFKALVVNNFPQIPEGSLGLETSVEGIEVIRKKLVTGMRSLKKAGVNVTDVLVNVQSRLYEFDSADADQERLRQLKALLAGLSKVITKKQVKIIPKTGHALNVKDTKFTDAEHLQFVQDTSGVGVNVYLCVPRAVKKGGIAADAAVSPEECAKFQEYFSAWRYLTLVLNLIQACTPIREKILELKKLKKYQDDKILEIVKDKSYVAAVKELSLSKDPFLIARLRAIAYLTAVPQKDTQITIFDAIATQLKVIADIDVWTLVVLSGAANAGNCISGSLATGDGYRDLGAFTFLRETEASAWTSQYVQGHPLYDLAVSQSGGIPNSLYHLSCAIMFNKLQGEDTFPQALADLFSELYTLRAKLRQRLNQLGDKQIYWKDLDSAGLDKETAELQSTVVKLLEIVLELKALIPDFHHLFIPFELTEFQRLLPVVNPKWLALKEMCSEALQPDMDTETFKLFFNQKQYEAYIEQIKADFAVETPRKPVKVLESAGAFEEMQRQFAQPPLALAVVPSVLRLQSPGAAARSGTASSPTPRTGGVVRPMASSHFTMQLALLSPRAVDNWPTGHNAGCLKQFSRVMGDAGAPSAHNFFQMECRYLDSGRKRIEEIRKINRDFSGDIAQQITKLQAGVRGLITQFFSAGKKDFYGLTFEDLATLLKSGGATFDESALTGYIESLDVLAKENQPTLSYNQLDAIQRKLEEYDLKLKRLQGLSAALAKNAAKIRGVNTRLAELMQKINALQPIAETMDYCSQNTGATSLSARLNLIEEKLKAKRTEFLAKLDDSSFLDSLLSELTQTTQITPSLTMNRFEHDHFQPIHNDIIRQATVLDTKSQQQLAVARQRNQEIEVLIRRLTIAQQAQINSDDIARASGVVELIARYRMLLQAYKQRHERATQRLSAVETTRTTVAIATLNTLLADLLTRSDEARRLWCAQVRLLSDEVSHNDSRLLFECTHLLKMLEHEMVAEEAKLADHYQPSADPSYRPMTPELETLATEYEQLNRQLPTLLVMDPDLQGAVTVLSDAERKQRTTETIAEACRVREKIAKAAQGLQVVMMMSDSVQRKCSQVRSVMQSRHVIRDQEIEQTCTAITQQFAELKRLSGLQDSDIPRKLDVERRASAARARASSITIEEILDGLDADTALADATQTIALLFERSFLRCTINFEPLKRRAEYWRQHYQASTADGLLSEQWCLAAFPIEHEAGDLSTRYQQLPTDLRRCLQELLVLVATLKAGKEKIEVLVKLQQKVNPMLDALADRSELMDQAKVVDEYKPVPRQAKDYLQDQLKALRDRINALLEHARDTATDKTAVEAMIDGDASASGYNIAKITTEYDRIVGLLREQQKVMQADEQEIKDRVSQDLTLTLQQLAKATEINTAAGAVSTALSQKIADAATVVEVTTPIPDNLTLTELRREEADRQMQHTIRHVSTLCAEEQVAWQALLTKYRDEYSELNVEQTRLEGLKIKHNVDFSLAWDRFTTATGPVQPRTWCGSTRNIEPLWGHDGASGVIAVNAQVEQVSSFNAQIRLHLLQAKIKQLAPKFAILDACFSKNDFTSRGAAFLASLSSLGDIAGLLAVEATFATLARDFAAAYDTILKGRFSTTHQAIADALTALEKNLSAFQTRAATAKAAADLATSQACERLYADFHSKWQALKNRETKLRAKFAKFKPNDLDTISWCCELEWLNNEGGHHQALLPKDISDLKAELSLAEQNIALEVKKIRVTLLKERHANALAALKKEDSFAEDMRTFVRAVQEFSEIIKEFNLSSDLHERTSSAGRKELEARGDASQISEAIEQLVNIRDRLMRLVVNASERLRTNNVQVSSTRLPATHPLVDLDLSNSLWLDLLWDDTVPTFWGPELFKKLVALFDARKVVLDRKHTQAAVVTDLPERDLDKRLAYWDGAANEAESLLQQIEQVKEEKRRQQDKKQAELRSPRGYWVNYIVWFFGSIDSKLKKLRKLQKAGSEEMIPRADVESILREVALKLGDEAPVAASSLDHLMTRISRLAGCPHLIPQDCWQDVFVCFWELAERCRQHAAACKQRNPHYGAELVDQEAQKYYALALALFHEIYRNYAPFCHDLGIIFSRAGVLLDVGVKHADEADVGDARGSILRCPLQMQLAVIADTPLGEAVIALPIIARDTTASTRLELDFLSPGALVRERKLEQKGGFAVNAAEAIARLYATSQSKRIQALSQKAGREAAKSPRDAGTFIAGLMTEKGVYTHRPRKFLEQVRRARVIEDAQREERTRVIFEEYDRILTEQAASASAVDDTTPSATDSGTDDAAPVVDDAPAPDGSADHSDSDEAQPLVASPPAVTAASVLTPPASPTAVTPVLVATPTVVVRRSAVTVTDSCHLSSLLRTLFKSVERPQTTGATQPLPLANGLFRAILAVSTSTLTEQAFADQVLREIESDPASYETMLEASETVAAMLQCLRRSTQLHSKYLPVLLRAAAKLLNFLIIVEKSADESMPIAAEGNPSHSPVFLVQDRGHYYATAYRTDFSDSSKVALKRLFNM